MVIKQTNKRINKQAFYCDKECQHKHWRTHVTQCSIMARKEGREPRQQQQQVQQQQQQQQQVQQQHMLHQQQQQQQQQITNPSFSAPQFRESDVQDIGFLGMGMSAVFLVFGVPFSGLIFIKTTQQMDFISMLKHKGLHYRRWFRE